MSEVVSNRRVEGLQNSQKQPKTAKNSQKQSKLAVSSRFQPLKRAVTHSEFEYFKF
jgi:hypothetical protein